MAKRYFLFLWFFLGLFAGPATWTVAQEGKPNIRVVVDMVQLNVAVTDSKGNYITGLRPQDFEVTEDSIPEKLAVFAEGHESISLSPGQAQPEAILLGQESGPAESGKLPSADSSQTLGSLV